MTEDGDNPASKWGKDRVDSDMEDPDSEDHMPIPDAHAANIDSALGNIPAHPIRDWPDDDDDDCQILEVLDPKPIRFMPPSSPPPADLDDLVMDEPPLATGGRGRKRGTAGTKAEASKRRKVGTPGPRARPTVIG